MSGNQVLIGPRKSPVQERSRRTVEAILTATAQVLVAHGYEGASTGLVAERAGVSIGTLYQYFPNKEALVEALVRQHVDELLSTVDRAMTSVAATSLNEMAGALVRAAIEAHSVDPPLHKVLIEEVPRRSGLRRHLDVSATLRDRIGRAIGQCAPELPAERIRMVAFVLEACIEALAHRAVLEAPDWLTNGELEAEAELLLRAYVTEPGGTQ